MSSPVWSSDESKAVLLTELEQTTGQRKQSKVMTIVAILLGTLLFTCVFFHAQIFASSSSNSASKLGLKAPQDDCIAAIQPFLQKGLACGKQDGECGCAVITSITPTDLAACPANLTDAETAQAAVQVYTAAIQCCSKENKTDCAADNQAVFQDLLVHIPQNSTNTTLVPGSGMGGGNRNGSRNGTMTNTTGTASPGATPSVKNSAQGLGPAVVLGMVLLF
jgi:hypothetical protein